MRQTRSTAAERGFAFISSIRRTLQALACLSLATGLAGCLGGGDPAEGTGTGTGIAPSSAPLAFKIGATATGLPDGGAVVLANGNSQLTISSNATLANFPDLVASGGSYAVTIVTAPAGYACTASNATGSGIASDVSNVGIDCSINRYAIGGTVTGLAAGQTVTLQNNGSGSTVVTGGGTASDSFSFDPLAYLSGYSVTVTQQPANQTCSITDNSGTGSGVNAAVSTVALTCSNISYTIGGTVSGLASGEQLTLINNADSTDIATATFASNSFSFQNPVSYLGSYNVTVSQAPQYKTCSPTDQSSTGKVVGGNVGSVAFNCAFTAYTVGGTVSGLKAGQTVTLVDNKGTGDNIAAVTGSGSLTDAFSFKAGVAYSGSYSVAVGTQPSNQTCSVSAGAGSVTGAVDSVAVTCWSGPTFSSTLTGLPKGAVVTLTDAGAAQIATQTITGSGTGSDSVTVPTDAASDSLYRITPSSDSVICYHAGDSFNSSTEDLTLSEIVLGFVNTSGAILQSLSCAYPVEGTIYMDSNQETLSDVSVAGQSVTIPTSSAGSGLNGSTWGISRLQKTGGGSGGQAFYAPHFYVTPGSSVTVTITNASHCTVSGTTSRFDGNVLTITPTGKMSSLAINCP